MQAKYILCLAMVSVGLRAAPLRAQVVSPGYATTEVMVNINSAILASGYDTSDPTVIVSGMFSNSCYSWNRATVTHATATLHEVRVIANLKPGMCLMVMIPFSREVRIGKLGVGTHTLRFINGDGTYQDKQLIVDHQ